MFLETPTFPRDIAFGALGGPGFMTAMAAGLGGDESRLDTWDEDLSTWEIGLINRNEALTRELISFFYCIAKGRANTFRFPDFQPGEAEGVNEYLGLGDNATTAFQLRKWYIVGANTYSKTILKPRAGTVTVTLNDVLTTAFTVSTAGVVTCTAAPGPGVTVRASFEFDKPVRFDTDWLQIRRVDMRLYSWESIHLVEVNDPR